MPRWTRSETIALLGVIYAIVGSGAGILALHRSPDVVPDRRGAFMLPEVKWEAGMHGVRTASSTTVGYQILGFSWTDAQPLHDCADSQTAVITIRTINYEPESNTVIGLEGETPQGDRLELSIDPTLGQGRLSVVELSWLHEVIRVNRRVLVTYTVCPGSLRTSAILAE
jgi:hypothetical protein